MTFNKLFIVLGLFLSLFVGASSSLAADTEKDIPVPYNVSFVDGDNLLIAKQVSNATVKDLRTVYENCGPRYELIMDFIAESYGFSKNEKIILTKAVDDYKDLIGRTEVSEQKASQWLQTFTPNNMTYADFAEMSYLEQNKLLLKWYKKNPKEALHLMIMATLVEFNKPEKN